jgi:hypothetical protein
MEEHGDVATFGVFDTLEAYAIARTPIEVIPAEKRAPVRNDPMFSTDVDTHNDEDEDDMLLSW